MQDLYERCTDISGVNNSNTWLDHISNEMCSWEKQLVTA